MEQAAVGEGGGSEKIFRDTYHHTRLLLIERKDDEGVGNQCKGMHLEGKVINYTVIIVLYSTYCSTHFDPDRQCTVRTVIVISISGK